MLKDEHRSCFTTIGGNLRVRAPEGSAVKSMRGFTLIELLIVVVIVGILASIAIPKFANTKDKAYIASMKSDLRNLATAEEAFFYDSAKYTTNLALLNNFQFTSGVVPTLNAVAGGWSARVTSPLVPGHACALFSGAAPAVAPATVEGRITCQ